MKSIRVLILLVLTLGIASMVWGGNNDCVQPIKEAWRCDCYKETQNCGWECKAKHDPTRVCCITYDANGTPISCEIKKKEECCDNCGSAGTCPEAKGKGGFGYGTSGKSGAQTKGLGEDGDVTGKIRFTWNMGKDIRGKTVGQIRLGGGLGASNSLAQVGWLEVDQTDNALSLTADSNGLVRVVAPQAVAEVENRASWGYELAFYHRTDTGGDGAPTNGAHPFVVWRVEDPDAGTAENRRLWVSEIKNVQTNRWEYEQNSTDSVSRIVLRSGNGLKVEELSSWGIAGGAMQVLEIRDGATGEVAERRVYTYEDYDFGQKRIKEEVGADGTEILEEETIYYTNSAQIGSYGYPALKVQKDGNWTRYEYDLHGRVVKEVTPWLDGDETSAESNSVVTRYDYTCLDTREVPVEGDLQWRKMERKIAGMWVATEYRAYFVDAATGDNVEIVEYADSSTASYGNSQNRQTQKWLHGDQDGVYRAHKPRVLVQADGRVTSYAYEQGDYASGGVDIGTFTSSTNGTYVRITETPDSLGQVPFKSVRTVRVVDEWGFEIQTEDWVCTGSNQYARMDWQTISRDEFGRELVRRYANGLATESTWGCCGLESETKPDGQSWSYVNDMLGRTTLSIKEDGPTEATVYDAAGMVLSKTLSGGGLSLSTSNRYDLAGRMVESWDEAGLSTTIEYGERTETITRPGGATKIATYYRDGKVKSISGTGVVSVYYEYGIGSDDGQWAKVTTGSTNSPMWALTVQDREGRTVRTEKPGFGGTVVNNIYEYDDEDQLLRESKPGAFDLLYMYNDQGELFRSGTDVTTNGVLNLDSMDRIREQRNEYVPSGSNWFHQQTAIIYPFENSAVPFTNSISRTQVGGSGCACESGGEEAVDALGNVTTSQTSVNPFTKTVTKTLTRAGIANAETTVTSNGLLQFRTLPTGAEYRYLYDGLGRQTGMVEPRTGTNLTEYLSNGWVDYVEDAAGYRTTFGYDAATGRRISVTDALTNTVYMAYDIQGRVTNTWGSTYPVAYEYDAYGRLVAMKTWRNTNEDPDVTQWHYDEATGLLTNKVYADDKGPSFDYDAIGRLTMRTWARGVTNAYDYDALGQLTGIDYTDSTPDVTFTYDRLGRQLTITDVLGTRTNVYDALSLLEEQLPDGTVLARSVDSFGRASGIVLDTDYAVYYGYDAEGRFATVSVSNAVQLEYAYVTNSSLLASWSVADGPAAGFAYKPNRDLRTDVANTFDGNPISSFAYAYDAAGHRTQRMDSGLTTNLFGYNIRSELVDATMGTNLYAYLYDSIGNRQQATANEVTNLYLVSELNQYTNINEGAVEPVYDADGNMTSHGNWNLTWDAENRLVKASPRILITGSRIYEYEYDFMGRRVKKTEKRHAMPVFTWTIRSFDYDGWNLVRERVEFDGAVATNHYAWGLDLSGTLQGAGGVGGLLMQIRSDEESPWFSFCDANGNITDLVDTNGAVVAHYEYDPYGNTIAQSGAQADANPFEFSSKYWDGETGFYYYGYRLYGPSMGRFVSRDPAGVVGGRNLYGFVGNRPVDRVDILGLRQWPWQGCCDGQTYNRFRKCCCCNGQTIRNGGAGCKIVSKAKKDTEVRRVSHQPPTNFYPPAHVWVEWPGGSGDVCAYNSLPYMSPSTYQGYRDPFYTKEEKIELSPCEYDITAFIDCLKQAALDNTTKPAPACNSSSCINYADNLLSTCMNKSRGCTMP